MSLPSYDAFDTDESTTTLHVTAFTDASLREDLVLNIWTPSTISVDASGDEVWTPVGDGSVSINHRVHVETSNCD